MKNNSFGKIFGVLLFTMGLVIGIVLSSLAIWVNLEGLAFWGYPESISFDFNLTREADLSRLECPILLTDGEIGTVKLLIRNPNEAPTRAWVKAHISMPDRTENMVRRIRNTNIQPGGESEMRWQVTTENTIFDHMILVRVFLQLSEFHPPSQTLHCGIISANLWELSSTQIIAGTVASSLLLMFLGSYTFWKTSADKKVKTNLVLKIILLIGALTIISILSGLFRIWVIGLIAIILIPIILFSAVTYNFDRTNKGIN